MNCRDRIGTAFSTYAPLTALVPEERQYESSAAPSSPSAPYLVHTYQETVPSSTPMKQVRVQVWVHDVPGTYKGINDILDQVRPAIMAAIGPTDTGWLSEIKWEGDSPDLYDDTTQTIVRYGTYLLTGSGV